MSSLDSNRGECTVVLDSTAIGAALHTMAREIAASVEMESLVLLGILTRGKPLADRLARELAAMTGIEPPVGSLATTLYRDDVGSGRHSVKPSGNTYFSFSLDGKTVLIVDDVLAAGRTTRAALDEVMDYGRPARIQLACLIDRGRRELPIQPDYLGWQVGTQPGDWVLVRLKEIDGEDVALLQHGVRPPRDDMEGS
ncbi:MAG: bifunctional pyr operon transcriptional regulator/uracil phosphoribosyltransferase PyrR [Candidatus Hydrogenedentes bacterium]|nr:bifunctional pyr operon transcriptional regulator/uracil phosphoribosyltransferase PyrR [Candidatus Hydrogenedentota bacterium]